ncbi:hypothetical protein, partial [Carbonactinospora thermoautotrophica]|uniref:hypothetical protein n=1 Tax=Carbonactinospora thermoautotrophica TaxID=1469144 RepID=UPI001E5C4B50
MSGSSWLSRSVSTGTRAAPTAHTVSNWPTTSGPNGGAQSSTSCPSSASSSLAASYARRQAGCSSVG